MPANDTAWKEFFAQTDTLDKIKRDGYAYVTAGRLKQFGGREPRLMAKQDTLSARPGIFRQNNLSIFPVKNGEYILFPDPERKTFFEFLDDDLDLPVDVYRSQVDLHSFDSYPGSQTLNESQALDFAFVSSLLKTFTAEEALHLVIRGRIFSGEFSFFLPAAHHKVAVSKVQIEVDAGYESDESIYLIEAKTGRRSDFHIRQLYYPYLEWSRRSAKRIKPIFLAYTNGKYFFYEFAFSADFGDLTLLRRACYSVNESPIAQLNLNQLFQSIAVEVEPANTPYPQANDLDKISDVVAAVDMGLDTKATLAERFEFDERQGDYYANAGRYLGLLERDSSQFALTRSGRQFLNLGSAADRTRLLVSQMLKRPTLRGAFRLLRERDMRLEAVSNREIADLIATHTKLTRTTPRRRASTVRSWLEWTLKNSEFVR